MITKDKKDTFISKGHVEVVPCVELSSSASCGFFIDNIGAEKDHAQKLIEHIYKKSYDLQRP